MSHKSCSLEACAALIVSQLDHYLEKYFYLGSGIKGLFLVFMSF